MPKEQNAAPIRLDKYIAESFSLTRSEARAAIRQGRVRLDSRALTDPAEHLAPEDRPTLDGETGRGSGFVYLMLHKPAGYVSSTDEPGQKTVLDLLPTALRRRGLFPAGRLDKDTEGLLLLTDDGDFCHRVISPKKKVVKVYYAETEGALTASDAARVAAGMTMPDGTIFRPGKLTILTPPSRALVAISEGQYHQVRRMLASLGKPVSYLKRLSIGGLGLDETLSPGAWRELTPEEQEAVFAPEIDKMTENAPVI